MLQMTQSHNFPWHPDRQSYLNAIINKFYLDQSVNEKPYGLTGGQPLL